MPQHTVCSCIAFETSVLKCSMKECESKFHVIHKIRNRFCEWWSIFCVCTHVGPAQFNILQFGSTRCEWIFFCIILTTHGVCVAWNSFKIASHMYQIKLLRMYILWLWNDRFHFSMLNETNKERRTRPMSHEISVPIWRLMILIWTYCM